MCLYSVLALCCYSIIFHTFFSSSLLNFQSASSSSSRSRRARHGLERFIVCTRWGLDQCWCLEHTGNFPWKIRILPLRGCAALFPFFLLLFFIIGVEDLSPSKAYHKTFIPPFSSLFLHASVQRSNNTFLPFSLFAGLQSSLISNQKEIETASARFFTRNNNNNALHLTQTISFQEKCNLTILARSIWIPTFGR